MTFPQWIRTNSEHYLLCDAQDRIARSKGFNAPNKPRGLKDNIWRRVLIPVYHMMPWGLKKLVMQSIPGSHKKSWPRKNFRSK